MNSFREDQGSDWIKRIYKIINRQKSLDGVYMNHRRASDARSPICIFQIPSAIDEKEFENKDITRKGPGNNSLNTNSFDRGAGMTDSRGGPVQTRYK